MLRHCALLAGALLAGTSWLSAAAPLRVTLIAGETDANWVGALQPVLAGASMEVRVATGPSLTELDRADVVLVGGWRGEFTAANVTALRAFIGARRGLVVLRPTTSLGATWSAFATEVLGGAAKGEFADGAAMQVIDIFPHPIVAGIDEFVTDRAMPRYVDLPRDIDIVMEGIVGEEATAIAWVRRVGEARICHLPAIEGAMLTQAAGQRLVTQAILWASRRDVPAAKTSVQRTFMPEAIPGAFAITLPQGPALCFDPARGGVNYAWDGDFVDLHPRWVTKRGEPARLSGTVFYRESDQHPWRDGAGKPAEIQFLGYRWEGRWVELHYTVAGRDVRETFRPLPEGNGFTREFAVGRGVPVTLMLGEAGTSAIGVRGAEMRGDRVEFNGQEAGTFSIELPLPARTPAGGAR